jgi:hypothetical protein
MNVPTSRTDLVVVETKEKDGQDRVYVMPKANRNDQASAGAKAKGGRP